jgi:uncharacterized membrane protein YhaH (DUF805 family)
MLGFIFGLNARLGRRQYFLITIGVAFLMTAICFVVARHTFQTIPKGMPLSIGALTGPAIAIAIIFVVITLTLQSMRIRDIGWDPVCVIPGWIAILIIDTVVARKFPGLSLVSGHHGTAVSAIVNLGLTLALLFWPSADDESSAPAPGGPSQPDPAPRGRGSVAAERLARASGGFGRRAF